MKKAVYYTTIMTLIVLFSSSIVYAKGMQSNVNQAATIIQRFKGMHENAIPRQVLRDARGLAILTVFKAGFMVSGSGGKGVVIARRGKGWSGPSAISTGGAGFGLQIGGQVTEFVIVLNTDEAVSAFSRGGNVVLGGDLSVAAGPIGREVAAGLTPMAAVYTYSRSQGLFAGASLQGAVIVAGNKSNAEYYGRAVTPAEILSGRVPPPSGARPLLRALSTY